MAELDLSQGRHDARERPVEEGCVWCKVAPDDADDDVRFHRIISTPEASHGTGDPEQICSRCLKHCREFKRALTFQQLTHREALEEQLGGPDEADEFGRVFAEAYNDMMDDVLEQFGLSYTDSGLIVSNAGEERDIPTDDTE